MEILYSLLGAFCVLIPICGLLTERLRIWQYICLVIYVTLMGGWGPQVGRITGVIMFGGVLMLLMLMLRNNKLVNLCLACLGYMFNILFNNIVLLMVSACIGIPVSVIERQYFILFSVAYCISLWGIVRVFRVLIYQKIHLIYYIEKMSYSVRYGLLTNLFMYIMLFIINMFWGEQVGYSNSAMQFNCILFLICALISNYLIIMCIRQVKNEEEQKAEKKRQQLLEEYIVCLENMVEETRIFKHDYKNMLFTMSGFIHENRLRELQVYFDQQLKRPAYSKLDEMQAWQYLKNIQPIEMKGLLFEKILAALGKGIRVQVEISENVNVVYEGISDLIRILGVFIDNAVEALEEGKGLLCIIIAKLDNRIVFQVMNECENQPDLSKIFCKGYSTKDEGRGWGLYSVRSLLQEHEDMAHECKVEQGMFIQRLEIPVF